MNHPTEDELLLLVYGELPPSQGAEIESHTAACLACREALARLEHGRVALAFATPARGRSVIIWATLALAAAAVLAGVIVTQSGSSRNPFERWAPTTTWSATAGYVAGGKAMVEIDAQLTRLEQGWSYGRP